MAGLHYATGLFSDPSISTLELLSKHQDSLESVNYELRSYGGIDPMIYGVATKVGVPEEEEEKAEKKRSSPQGFEKPVEKPSRKGKRRE